MWGQADREFVDILSAVRGGRCSTAVLDKLKDKCRRPLGLLDGILPTKVNFCLVPLHTVLNMSCVPLSCNHIASNGGM